MKKQKQILKWKQNVVFDSQYALRKLEILSWIMVGLLWMVMSANLMAQIASPPMYDTLSNGGWNVNGNVVTIADYNSVGDLRNGINELHRNEEAYFNLCPNSIANIYMPTQAVWNSWEADKKALHIVNEERRARGGVIYPETGFYQPGGPVKGYPYSGVPKVVDEAAEWWVDWLVGQNRGIGHCADEAPADRRCPDQRIKYFGGNCKTPHGGLEGMAGINETDDAKMAIRGILMFTYGSSGHRHGVLNQEYKDDFGAPREEGYVGFGTGANSASTGMLAFKMGDTPSDQHMRDNGNCTYNWIAKTSEMPGCTRYLAALETAYQEITAGGTYNVPFASSACFKAIVPSVRIRMSIDGGTTFPNNLILADNIPSTNTTATVNIPNGTNTSNVVIKIESANVGCVYFSDEVVRRVQHCIPPNPGTAWDAWSISSFTLSVQNNTIFTNTQNNAKVSYEDFTNAAPINLIAGTTVNYSMQADPSKTKDIWIDQNRNGVFDFPQDRILSTPNANGSFITPANLAHGTYRMRIRIAANYNSFATNACGIDTYGQIEDYRLVIGNTMGGGNSGGGDNGDGNTNPQALCTPTFAKPKWASLTITRLELSSNGAVILDNTVNDINTNYENFTANEDMHLDLTAGQVVNYIATSSGNGAADIWIDLNRDGQLTNEERIHFNPTGGSAPKVGNFTIPQNTDGHYFMRIRVLPNYQYNACVGNQWGQTEDYSIFVESGL